MAALVSSVIRTYPLPFVGGQSRVPMASPAPSADQGVE